MAAAGMVTVVMSMTTITDGGDGDGGAGNTVNAVVMLNRINLERANSGAGALTWQNDLETAALAHSNDMRDNDFLATPAAMVPRSGNASPPLAIAGRGLEKTSPTASPVKAALWMPG